MKKKKLNAKKIALQKNTIVALNDAQNRQVQGGSVIADPKNSYVCSVSCPFTTP